MLRKWKDFFYGEAHSMQERIFVLITVVLAVAFAFFVVTNLITGASLWNVLILVIFVALLGLIGALSVRRKRIGLGAGIISALIIFLLLPYMFFSSGSIYGGLPIWFIFAALFVNLILSGRSRTVFLISILAVSAACYIVAFTNPSLIHQNVTRTAYIDSYAALFFITLAVSVMVRYEIVLYQQENRKAEAQKREIEELNIAQSRFFSSMSHEIRTPINTIIGLNEMILREDVSEEVAEDAANIQAASRMLLHLINDILDMSKLESGSMQLTPVAYKVGDMLSELVGMFWGRAREKGLEFRVDIAPEVPAELFGDDVRIKQVLINVLNNAIKYTREGSVTFGIQCGELQGSIREIIYTVSDTGIGIKKESMPYLFTAFKRVDEESNRKIEGTGLGLSIVKQLVDLMGGSVTVNSVFTQGSTFIITLPQQAAGEETVGALDMEARAGGSGRSAYQARFEAPDAHVLVVDDNASNLLVVSKLLRGTRVQVDTASSGEEALRKTLENAYDVIFMDHMMPEMDGIECRRRILAQTGGKCRRSKILALTANADAESRALYEREGFDGFLTKPIDGNELERELYHQLPEELVHVLAAESADLLAESVAWIRGAERKRMVAVATDSLADLPRALLEQYEIATIPYRVVTEYGVFRDGVDLDTSGLLAFMADHDTEVAGLPADVEAYEKFFADLLKRANHVVFVSLTAGVGNSGYPNAAEAAKAFNNVTVVDSGHLSSGQGLLALEACRLAEEGRAPAEIAKRLEEMKELIQTSFIVENMDNLARAGQVNERLADLTKAMAMHPVLKLKNGKLGLSRVYLGSRKHVWKKYIENTLDTPGDIDRRMLFITYSGVSLEELDWIREQVEEELHFEQIWFQKAAPAVALSCGPGTFGLLFRNKPIS